MGMDVFGTKPVNESGNYFCRNMSGWANIVSYLHQIAPDITSKCPSLTTNDGFGLNAQDAYALANVLDEEIANGGTAEYETRYHTADDPDDEPDELFPFVRNMREFNRFLRSCGGFEIW
jgi:hypothetical protein